MERRRQVGYDKLLIKSFCLRPTLGTKPKFRFDLPVPTDLFDRRRVSLLPNAGKISFGIDGFGGE
jgi:hypothetical protein